jgi:UDP-N-acetylglucosamine--N-acetylmuramyl-(pentapeptide) pyrophosphoryl-undecaprenol N-acetylglucosamine transferase
MKDALRVIFAGGGTGGHLIPALAIADKLKSRVEPDCKTEFMFVGTRRGLEYRMKDRLGYPLTLINVRGVARSMTLSNLVVPFLLIGSVVKCMRLISRFGPDIVVGTGGYVMGPVFLSAALMGKRRVIQEQNSFPGITTRKLAPRADRVFLGFSEAAQYLGKRSRVIVTGNPVREVIGKLSKDEGREYYGIDSESRVILVLGGSQGAAAINRNILRDLDKLPDGHRLIWQTGERDYKEVAAQAGGKVQGRSLFAFTDRLEMAYAAADLVIARAGALTLAEIEAARLPSILVPFPYAAGDHQRKNAESFVNKGAAIMFDDCRLDEISLLAEAVKLLESGKKEQMAAAVESMQKERKRSAADLIVDEILDIVRGEGRSN